ncbi:MAG: type II toxin-antitoxin system Phd/YefM family antitoxin [Paraburkholderia sp.]|jgi:PHD/YefM family antitoxin component YafN of YafNO toxin-antitoxin module|uniref:type II toxin-antitoxin system Phd/YefM family antitoxin n=1 Tax=Burkholderiaceae TaxID=119060 RepID=UPI0010F74ACB|nr:type II toxin-antitoxin system Phd/YefM family antitoxin [Burkholderia sp. 4M9327F10]
METLATHGARAITTRDLSKNPSKALRDATAQPLIVMRHQRPIACLVSIEQWAELMSRLKDSELSSSVAQIEMQIRRLDLEAPAHFPPDFPALVVGETYGK